MEMLYAFEKDHRHILLHEALIFVYSSRAIWVPMILTIKIRLSRLRYLINTRLFLTISITWDLEN